MGFLHNSLLCSLLFSYECQNDSQDDNEYNVQGGCLYSFSLLEMKLSNLQLTLYTSIKTI